MTDAIGHRVSLIVAIVGALIVGAHTWHEHIRAAGTELPVFKQQAPDVRGWPTHQYLPIG